MMMSIEERYNIKPMLLVGGIWIIAILTMISTLSSDNINFFKFGPGDTSFLQFRIDTWPKWGLVMGYSFFSQIINSLMRSTIYSFIINVIRDHNTAWNGSPIFGQFICVIYKLYYWINDICDVLLVLTLQVQYWIPGLVSHVAVSMWNTHNHLRDKPYSDIYDIV